MSICTVLRAGPGTLQSSAVSFSRIEASRDAVARVAHITNRAAAGNFGKWIIVSLPSPAGLVVKKGQGTIPEECFLSKLFDSVSLGLSEQVFLSLLLL